MLLHMASGHEHCSDLPGRGLELPRRHHAIPWNPERQTRKKSCDPQAEAVSEEVILAMSDCEDRKGLEP